MIIFLHGADTFRSRRFLRDLKEKFARDVDPSASSLDVLDGSNATLREINEKIHTGSLFVKKRLVVIEDIFKNKKEKIFSELVNYLPGLAAGENDVIIFRDSEINTKETPLKAEAKKLFAYLNSQPYSQEFKILSNAQLLNFLKKEAAAYGKEIENAAASRLIASHDSNLWSISNDLNKIAYANSNKTITLDDIRNSVNASYDENIFGLTDAFSAKDKKSASRLLAEQYGAGLSDEYILSMLIRQFKILLQIRAALDSQSSPATLASELKLHPFVIKKGLVQAKNFNTADLKAYLNRLMRLDFQNKTGRGDIKAELSLLISEL